MNFSFSDDNDAMANIFINRRRCIKPVFYSNPMNRLLSYEIEPRLTINTHEREELHLLQKTVSLLDKKLHEATFDENEKRTIQRIVIDGDDNEDEYAAMEIIYPMPIIDIKNEPTSSTSESIPSSPLAATAAIDHVASGKVPFQINVSICLNLVEYRSSVRGNLVMSNY